MALGDGGSFGREGIQPLAANDNSGAVNNNIGSGLMMADLKACEDVKI